MMGWLAFFALWFIGVVLWDIVETNIKLWLQERERRSSPEFLRRSAAAKAGWAKRLTK